MSYERSERPDCVPRETVVSGLTHVEDLRRPQAKAKNQEGPKGIPVPLYL